MLIVFGQDDFLEKVLFDDYKAIAICAPCYDLAVLVVLYKRRSYIKDVHQLGEENR